MAKLLRNPKAVYEVPGETKGAGVAAWRGMPGRMRRAHRHSDIEFNYVLRGQMTYLLAGGIATIRPGRLALFWAGAPHWLTHVAPGTETVWVLLPLAWFLQWQLPPPFVQRLLRGELVQPIDDATATLDEALLLQWIDDTASGSGDRRAAATLEIQARCQRLAHRLATSPARSRVHPAGSHVERLASSAAQRYTEPIHVADLAAAAGLHPNYAMNLFKDVTGISLWDYLTRLRISHAQRLLLTTDWKIDRIARDSGFHSVSSFYDAFARIVGSTPRAYRDSLTI